MARVTSDEHRRNHCATECSPHKDHPNTTVKKLTQVNSYVFLLLVFVTKLEYCWKSASLAGKRIRFGTNRVTISEPIGWNHRRVIQLPRDLHSIHIDIRPKLFSYCLDIRCVYLILSLFPTSTLSRSVTLARYVNQDCHHRRPVRTSLLATVPTLLKLDRITGNFALHLERPVRKIRKPQVTRSKFQLWTTGSHVDSITTTAFFFPLILFGLATVAPPHTPHDLR
jgi:hypothetical protein